MSEPSLSVSDSSTSRRIGGKNQYYHQWTVSKIVIQITKSNNLRSNVNQDNTKEDASIYGAPNERL